MNLKIVNTTLPHVIKREKTHAEYNCSGIYAITSNDGKVYVGFSKDIRRRIVAHKSGLRRNIHFNFRLQNFYNKNGISALSFKVIEECDCDVMPEREKFWISYFDSIKKGFNLTEGGDKSPMESEEAQKIGFETRIRNGKAVLIYAYSPTTGKLIYTCYGYNKMSSLTGCTVANMMSCVHKGKVTNGIHFSQQIKTENQVLKDVIYNINSETARLVNSIKMKGNGNPMFGKKRPEISGDNNPFSKMIKAGYVVKKVKLKLTEQEIITLFNSGLKSKEIATKAGCGSCNINIILRKNGIHMGKGWRREKNTNLSNEPSSI